MDWAERLAAMSDRELSEVIEGTKRLGATPDEDLMVWNLAIDEEQERNR